MRQSKTSRVEHRKRLLLQVLMLATVVMGTVCFVFFQKNTAEKGSKPQPKARKIQYINPSDTAFIYAESPDYADAIPIEQAESFIFDPNTADSTALRRLGLSTHQIRNLYKYRAHRGIFHYPDDFKKLHGLTVQQWHHLQPLIRIGQAYQYLADSPEAYRPTDKRTRHNQGENGHQQGNKADSLLIDGQRIPRDTTLYPYKLHEGETVDLNLADTVQLKRIPGVGSHYARKIAEYRKQLGGFISINQLEEIENLPLGIEEYLTLTPVPLKKLQLNQYTFRQLYAHPYINFYQAQTIVNHRRQIGPIHSLQDLSLYDEFTPADFQRLAPYVDFAE